MTEINYLPAEDDAYVSVTATSDGQAAFAFDFYTDVAASLVARRTAAADGAVTLYTAGVDFTVAGLLDPDGGTITLVSGVAATILTGDEIEIWRDTEIKRASAYQSLGDYFAAAVNGEQTKQFAILQEMARDLGRALKVDYGQTGSTVPAPEAGKVLVGNSGGTAYENALAASLGAVVVYDEDDMASNSATGVPSQQSTKAYADTKAAKSANLSDLASATTALTNLGFSAFFKTIINAASAAALQTAIGATTVGKALFTAVSAAAARSTLATAIFVSSVAGVSALDTSVDTVAYLTDSNRAGVFVFDNSDLSGQVTADTAEGVYIAPDSDGTGASGAWVRSKTSEWIHASWFGVTADGSTDDKAALQAAIDYMEYVGGGTLLLPAGQINVSGTVTIQASSVQLVGHGSGGTFNSNDDNKATNINYTGAGSEAVLDLGDGGTNLYTGIVLRDFTITGNVGSAAGVIGWRLNLGVIKSYFQNVHAIQTEKGCQVLGTGSFTSFGNRWRDCTIEHFDTYGIELYGDGNESVFDGIKFMSTNTLSPTACIRVGSNEACHGVRILNCDFGATNVAYHIDASECSGLLVSGCTIEASGNSTTTATYLIRLGNATNTTAVSGFTIVGCRFLGNNKAQYAIRFEGASYTLGGWIAGNSFEGTWTQSQRISNAGCAHTGLGPNEWNGGTPISSQTGLYEYLRDSVPSYVITNYTADRTYNADATTVAELADVLATLISDLGLQGRINANVT